MRPHFALGLNLVCVALAACACFTCHLRAQALDESGWVEIKPNYPAPIFVGVPIPAGDIPNLEMEDPDDLRARLRFKVPPGTENVAKGKPVTSSDPLPIIGDLPLVTDGDADGADGCYVELAPGLQWVQIDLGQDYHVWKLLLWHFHKQGAVYFDTVVQVSSDAEFKKNVTTIFNNDHDNSSKLGKGGDNAYVETNHGRLIDGKGVLGRYVRLYSNGNTGNELNHYVEVQVYGSSADPQTIAAMQAAGQRRAADELAEKQKMAPPRDPNEPKAGATLQVEIRGGAKMPFCYCPSGVFTMGSLPSEKFRSDDESRVQVVLSSGFWMAQAECTQAQWQAVMGANPSHSKGEDLPVENVSWEEVQDFVSKLNQTGTAPLGMKFALPTEAQWEHACRSGTESAFSFGGTLTSKQANFDGNYPYGVTETGPYLAKTAKARSYGANAWGLHDMHGNLREWCADWYTPKLSGGNDPKGPAAGTRRVIRGGSMFNAGQSCRSAFRDKAEPTLRDVTLGFRLALVRVSP